MHLLRECFDPLEGLSVFKPLLTRIYVIMNYDVESLPHCNIPGPGGDQSSGLNRHSLITFGTTECGGRPGHRLDTGI